MSCGCRRSTLARKVAGPNPLHGGDDVRTGLPIRVVNASNNEQSGFVVTIQDVRLGMCRPLRLNVMTLTEWNTVRRSSTYSRGENGSAFIRSFHDFK